MSPESLVEPKWLQILRDRQPGVIELTKTTEEQRRLGYSHTLREICQQPSTWLRTCDLMTSRAVDVKSLVTGISSLVLTGSGSSEYAGDCVRTALQNELGVVAQALGAGVLLTHLGKAIPPGGPGLLVSVARSGDSPESVGAVDLILRVKPEIRHLILTCNRAGRLATNYRDNSRAVVITLSDETNDQGLVMTSSFTNLVLAARFLGLTGQIDRYRAICEQLSRIASDLIEQNLGVLADVAKAPFKRALFLGSGSRFGGAREAALKMLEMTAGRVSTMCESYLSLRHGPMTYVNGDTLVVCFLSSEPMLRAYEADLLRELDQKELGLMKVIIGEDVSTDLVRSNDVVIECKGLSRASDENAPVIDVLAGQLLAFFRCREQGLRPDSPSEKGIINRVVQTFALYSPEDLGINGQGRR